MRAVWEVVIDAVRALRTCPNDADLQVYGFKFFLYAFADTDHGEFRKMIVQAKGRLVAVVEAKPSQACAPKRRTRHDAGG
mmetsp:Transcript_42386/g.62912  ORF Transcript_42386/g.62912 Transcript_42386/m.62912 type:complete len:80 (+) Transcript_42386:217-456(+)